LRRIAVAMVRAGKTRIEAAETVGVNRRFVGQWVKAAARSGEAVLAGRRRGRRPGEQQALGVVQEDRLRRRDRREIGGATAVGYFRARSLTEGGCVAWVLRLVEIGAEGEGPCADVVEAA
jgi:transposase